MTGARPRGSRIAARCGPENAEQAVALAACCTAVVSGYVSTVDARAGAG